MMSIQDWAFQHTFERVFVYNLLYEDTEVDDRFLDVDNNSTILGISGAGCRVAGHLSHHPRRIDAVDINGHHLALTALKVAAAQKLRSYTEFYDLFGRGWQLNPEKTLSNLVYSLPQWIQKHWKRHHGMFSKSLYRRGLTARLFQILRERAGIDAQWLLRMLSRSFSERQEAIRRTFEPVLAQPAVKTLLESPLNQIAVGVNRRQANRMLKEEGTDYAGFVINHFCKVAETDLETNWFAWYAAAGHYNHDHPDAVPPYLRAEHHKRSLESPTETFYHRNNIFNVLGQAGPSTWSHYTLCDAMDWMPWQTQKTLLEEIHRTSRDGGILQYRSVLDESLVKRHELDDRFILIDERSDLASKLDRSRQYRRVNFYRIIH